ncbi:SseB family protein [Serinicoccus marinus]|uniref:SseB family protein n=1 Tax=Serinicoccus marinus TaxID=247333 RepID=UPI0003B583F4|nr:SseB family protein [Serinicoccus marinus]
MSHRFADHRPQDGADTAGTPWSGRTLTGTGFDGDTGAADERLSRLLGGVDPEPAAEDVVAAVARARLIVPVVAVAGEVDTSSGIPADASSDMASVTLVAPDGQRALPAFTSTAALGAWDPQARPVPVTAQRAALAAVQEGCTVIPLDLAPAPGPPAYTLSGSMVWALAMARDWVPAHRDEQVAAAVAATVQQERDVVAHRLAGSGGELVVELRLRPGLSGPQVQALVTRVGEALAVDAETRARIDAVTFRLATA